MGRSQRIPRLSAQAAGRPLADDTGCTVLHVDMDAFYASVELRDRPELRGTPVIVGSPNGRGVVLSATYEAREFGVRSAMSMARARRLCPQAEIVGPHHGEYAAVSGRVMEIFRSVTPLVQPIASDEAFLDVAGAIRLFGRPVLIGADIRRRIEESEGITCSVGVATTMSLAKLASTRCKPDGMLVVPADGIEDFLHPLPVSALWGVGEKAEEALLRRGLRTVGDIAFSDPDQLRRAVGDAVGTHLYSLARGRDERSVRPDRAEKSIGAEETFSSDLFTATELHRELLRLADRVTGRVRKAGVVGRTVAIKVRFGDFRTITRSRTLPDATDTSRDVYDAARELFDAIGTAGRPIRLVGVRLENLSGADDSTRQMLIGESEHGWRDLDRVADRIAGRFGGGALGRGSLVGRPAPRGTADQPDPAQSDRSQPSSSQPSSSQPGARQPGARPAR